MSSFAVYVVRDGCSFNPVLVTMDLQQAKHVCDTYTSGSEHENLNGAFVDEFKLSEARHDEGHFNNIYQHNEG
jgi:hypothetical protein